MNTNFNIVFTLKILHTYFEKDVCSCLQFQPAAGTLDLIKRFKFRMSENVNGFDFYSTSALSLSASLEHVKAATGQTYFEFDLLNNNDAFYCFTALPMSWTGQLLYDSAAADMLPEGKIIVLKETLSAPRTTEIVGNLKVRFDDILKYSAAGEAINYEIRFMARATQWQYYVVNRNAVDLANASVKGKENIVFENAGNVTIETGEQALLFSSGEQLFPLSKFPKYKFDLVNTLKPLADQQPVKSSSKIIVKGLPNPDPLRIGVTKINDKTQVSSPIYIYV